MSARAEGHPRLLSRGLHTNAPTDGFFLGSRCGHDLRRDGCVAPLTRRMNGRSLRLAAGAVWVRAANYVGSRVFTQPARWQGYWRRKVAVLLRQLIPAIAEPFPSGGLDPDGATCTGPVPSTRSRVVGIRKVTSCGTVPVIITPVVWEST